MVSLDDAVVARLEKGGKRYEILVDPELVEPFKSDPDSTAKPQKIAVLAQRVDYYAFHQSASAGKQIARRKC